MYRILVKNCNGNKLVVLPKNIQDGGNVHNMVGCRALMVNWNGGGGGVFVCFLRSEEYKARHSSKVNQLSLRAYCAANGVKEREAG